MRKTRLLRRDVVVSFAGKVTIQYAAGTNPPIVDGCNISDWIWKLAGAFDGSTIFVKRRKTRTVFGVVDALVLEVDAPEILERRMERKILERQDQDGSVTIIDNVAFYIKKEYRGQGIASYSLLTEALAANELGFAMIVATAANDPAVGWKVWPKLGYDAEIPDDILAKMMPDLLLDGRFDLNQPMRISTLLDGGRYDLWERDGSGCIMEFDVSDLDSWSMTRLIAKV
ncbi:GNAT family N-acetyltransferase [Duganella radicis]|uniref:Uncharacterized protein n=1 Tax=Duganella radicis TaxID=551988 RepID=A0A6L6PHW7_9BURK|nr:GNAT family N-acetyltransferase [Duganella radicis]MTV37875.1 hypothetical protein [Duganella radicis]